jgi:uncharacterized membrane protein YgcG
MKGYQKFVTILGSISILLILLVSGFRMGALTIRRARVGERSNTVCLTQQRVFDYADVLTDREEQKLEALIAKRERQLGLDIVIVTINEDVGSSPYNASINHTIDFAEDFYAYMGFGYDGFTATFYSYEDGTSVDVEEAGRDYMMDDKAIVRYAKGAGVIWVDNWYDLNGDAESAFLAYRGASRMQIFDRAYNIYTSEDALEELEEDVWEYSNTNPYRSYRRMINHLTSDMIGTNMLEANVPMKLVLFVPAVLAFLFVLFHLNRRIGTKTTEMTTYVQGGHADILSRQDILISRHTVQHHFNPDSGGGGGSSGGGGGGHSGGHSGGGGRH